MHTFHDFLVKVAPIPMKTTPLDLPSVLVQRFDGNKSVLRWGARVWPAGTESFLALGAYKIGRNLDWWEAQWANAAYLELLCDPFTAFGPIATLLLCLGLAAKEPGESGLATDAAIAAVGDGRLTGGAIGEVMATLLPTGLVKAARWAKTLAVVASASPLQAVQVGVAIQRALRGDPASGPRDEGALVDVLRELLLAANAKVTDAEAWAYLAGSRHRAKLKDVAP